MNVCGNDSMCASEPPLIAHNSLFQQNSQVDQNLIYEFHSTIPLLDHKNFNSPIIQSSGLDKPVFQNLIVKQNHPNQYSPSSHQNINFECTQTFESTQYFNPHQNLSNHQMPNITYSQSQEPNLNINSANSLELDSPQICNTCSAILEADMPCLQLSNQCHFERLEMCS